MDGYSHLISKAFECDELRIKVRDLQKTADERAEMIHNCAKQNQILRDTVKEAKELVSEMILAVHMPAMMVGWKDISARALKLLEGETNGKQEESSQESQEANKEVIQKGNQNPGGSK